jgi:general secretion pathway protein E
MMTTVQPIISNQSLAEYIQQALIAAKTQKRPMLQILEELLALDAEDFVIKLAQAFQITPISMKEMHQMTPAYEVLSFNEGQRKGCIAFKDAQSNLCIVIIDPIDDTLQTWLDEVIQYPFKLLLAHSSDIAAYQARHEESMRALDQLVPDAEYLDDETSTPVNAISIQSINEDSNPIVKLINSTLYDGLKVGASDIHLECANRGLEIKYRIDGVMTNIGGMQGRDNADQAISRIKVMAQLDIAERRIPQDGRFKVSVLGREVDFRVSIMPSVFGEDAVLRILDRKSISEEVNGLSLQALGFNAEIIEQFRKLASEPYGMVLVTGPTGSGKTTSLYAAISEVNTGYDKIITIEDPVEYQLSGVLQIPVNEKKGLTFSRGLRSILRHDPDKIMVGEIRDTDTAQIAVQAALTGHLVFTTVHANSVLDVIGRFMHMGVDLYNFVSAVNGIMAQRLIRELCVHCAEDYTPPASLIEASNIPKEMLPQMRFKYAKGCGHCRGSGYKGRKAIAELLVLNDELREMIIAREPIRKLKEAARRNGLRSIREAALEHVSQGLTTLQEINRVTFVD